MRILFFFILCLVTTAVLFPVASYAAKCRVGDGEITDCAPTTQQQQKSVAPADQKTTGDYFSGLYAWMLGIVGLAALGAIVYGGVLYIFSGTISSTGEATKLFKNAAFGVLIAALSWIILNTINPELVGNFSIENLVQNAKF